MANEIQEFFLGQNKQEIENERKKIKALMGLFPYSMGNTDQTNYILRKTVTKNRKEVLEAMLLINPTKLSFRTKVRNPKNKTGEKCPNSLILGTGTLKFHLQEIDLCKQTLSTH